MGKHLGTILALLWLALAGAPELATAQDAPPPPAQPPAAADERLDRIERELEKTKAELEALKKERAGGDAKPTAEPATPPAEPGAAPAEPAKPDEKPPKAHTAAELGEEFEKRFGKDVIFTFKDGFRAYYLDPERTPETAAKDAVIHSFGVSGRVHVDYRGFFENDYHAQDDRFLVRRARIMTSGFLFKYHEYQLEFDLGGFSSGLRDAYLDFHYIDEARLRVGSMKVPFSLEQLISSRYIPFVERSLFNIGTSAIQFDIGAEVHGQVGPLQYFAGVFNGSGNQRSDENSDKDVAARLLFQPFKGDKTSALEPFGIGASVTAGHQTFVPQDLTTYAGTTYVDFASNTAQSGTRWRLGGDLQYAVGPVYFLGEYFHMRLEDVVRGTGATMVEESGDIISFYVGGVLYLTGEKAEVGKRVVPKSNFDPFAGGTGAFAIAARYDYLHTEKDLFVGGIATGTDQIDTVTLGVRWFLNPYVKVMADFYKAWFDDEITSDREKDEWGTNIRFALEY